MTEAEIKKLFIDAGALMDGHFLLTSGLHSPQYVDKFKILTKPKLADPLMREMASHWVDKNIDIVVGPAVGGIILSYEIAKHLETEGIFLEREEGEMIFRRGFALEQDQRVLLVEDIVTTGGSIHEIHKKVVEQGAEVGQAGHLRRTGQPARGRGRNRQH